MCPLTCWLFCRRGDWSGAGHHDGSVDPLHGALHRPATLQGESSFWVITHPLHGFYYLQNYIGIWNIKCRLFSLFLTLKGWLLAINKHVNCMIVTSSKEYLVDRNALDFKLINLKVITRICVSVIGILFNTFLVFKRNICKVIFKWLQMSLVC